MTDPRREQWLRQAAARWAHLPEGPERDARINRTAAEIASEAALVSIKLPDLHPETEREVLEEAALEELHQWMPLDEATIHVVQPLIDESIDRRYRQLALLAREQAAPVHIRARLIERRIARRLRRVPCIEYEALATAIAEVALIIAEEDDSTTRALAEGAAITSIIRRSKQP